jgi:hypothetical protein
MLLYFQIDAATKKMIKVVRKKIPNSVDADDEAIKNPIYLFFDHTVTKDPKNHKLCLHNFAKCKVINSGTGLACGDVLQTPQSSTTGPRNHLKRLHPKIWAEYEAIVVSRQAINLAANDVVEEIMAEKEGVSASKTKATTASTATRRPNPMANYLKVSIRSKQQLRFDMATITYLVKCLLPYAHVAT